MEPAGCQTAIGFEIFGGGGGEGEGEVGREVGGRTVHRISVHSELSLIAATISYFVKLLPTGLVAVTVLDCIWGSREWDSF